jgi:putative tryptophan/tyrosine transport system substrate-binding protein
MPKETGSMITRRAVLLGVGATALMPVVAETQQTGKVWRIGYLRLGLRPVPGSNPTSDAFLKGLRDLGYVEGRHVVLEIRYAEGRNERFPALAAELVSLKVDVIVAESTPAAIAAKQASSTIPSSCLR